MEIGKKVDKTEELIDLFEPAEGSVNMYYGRIGHGKTYAATADILDLLSQGHVVYCNWVINYEGFDERDSFWHLFYNTLFFKDLFFFFPKENLHYFNPDNVDADFLASLTDCDVFIDEGQWILDSYEGTKFSKTKRKLVLHTRHMNRSLNIISQRTQAIQVSARGQVNRFFKCEKKMEWPFLIFKRIEFQDMKDNDVDENSPPISEKTYFASKKVLNAYDTKYLRAGVPRSQEIYFEAYEFGFKERWQMIIHKLAGLMPRKLRKHDNLIKALSVEWDRPEHTIGVKSLGVKSSVATINSPERLNTVGTGSKLSELMALKRQLTILKTLDRKFGERVD